MASQSSDKIDPEELRTDIIKQILFWGIAIFVFIYLPNSCSDNSANSTPSPTRSVSSQIQPSTSKNKNLIEQDWFDSSISEDFIGHYAWIRIKKAHCSYQPSVSNSPTFCNDAPYPNHDFTVVVWEKNVSYLDGKCLLIHGFITEYNGKPQFTTESLDGIETCD